MKGIPPWAAARFPRWVQDGAKLLGDITDPAHILEKAFPLNDQGHHFATELRN